MHISDELRQYVADNPHIEKIYFDHAGNHHFNVHEHQGKLYSRQRQAWEEAREDYEICEILTREAILEQELEELIEDDRHHRHPKPKIHPILAFNIIFNNKNFNCMGVVTSLNLTSAAPVQLFMTVVDPSGNPIAGVATGFSYVVADPTIDIAVVDPDVPADVDIHATANTGTTTVTPTANFVSSLKQADGVTPVFSGPITGPALTLTNNIPVTTLTPSLAFNQ